MIRRLTINLLIWSIGLIIGITANTGLVLYVLIVERNPNAARAEFAFAVHNMIRVLAKGNREMSRATQFKLFWAHLKAIDHTGGKLLGNTGHMRKNGSHPVDYALSLAWRTLAAGITFAAIHLLSVSLFILFPALGPAIGLSQGLLVLVLAGYLYPGNLAFLIGLTTSLIPASTATIDAVFKGIPVLDFLSLPLVLQMTSFGLILLTAASGVGWLVAFAGREIDRRFRDKPKPAPRPGSLKFYKVNGLLTDEENFTRMLWMIAAAVSGSVAAVIMNIGFFGMVVWGLPSALISVAGFAALVPCWFHIAKRLDALRDRVRARVEMPEGA